MSKKCFQDQKKSTKLIEFCVMRTQDVYKRQDPDGCYEFLSSVLASGGNARQHRFGCVRVDGTPSSHNRRDHTICL